MLTALVSAAPSALLLALPLAHAPQQVRCPDWGGERLERLEARLAEQVNRFVARIPCGFAGGPCCEAPLRHARRTCHTPHVCEDEVCR